MRLLSRYLARAVIADTALVILVLLGIQGLLEFVDQLPDIGVSNYNFFSALVYVLLELPSDLYQLFPMAGFLGCLMALGRLATSSQLIAMRAAGASMVQITSGVLKAAILLIVAVTLLGEWVAPPLHNQAEKIKAYDLGHASAYSRLSGEWVRNGSVVAFFGAIGSAKSADHISYFNMDNAHHLRMVGYADHAVLTDSTWRLNNVVESILQPAQITSSVFSTLDLDLIFDPSQLIGSENKTADQQSIVELYQSIRYRRHAQLQSTIYQFAFWQRLLQPLTTLMMITLGVPFIFGSLRETTMGVRLLTGLIVGFTFYMLQQFFGPIAMVFQWPPAIAALIPTALFVIIGLFLWRRVN